MRRRVVVILAMSAVVGSLAAAAGYLARQDRFLQHGIDNTRDSIKRVDVAIDENHRQLDRVMLSVAADLGSVFDQRSGGDTHPVKNAVDAFKRAKRGYDGTTAVLNGDYAQALGKVAEEIAKAWAKRDPRVGLAVQGVNQAANLLEVAIILKSQAQLLERRLQLEKHLISLEFRQAGRIPLEEAIKWLNEFNRNEHAEYLRWLESQRVEHKAILGTALEDVFRNASCATAAHLVQGAVIVDPDHGIDDLAEIPNINPAFVEAMRRQAAFLRRGDLESVHAAAASAKPDGPLSYVPMFARTSQDGAMRQANDTTCADRVATDRAAQTMLGDMTREFGCSGICDDMAAARRACAEVRRWFAIGREIVLPGDRQGSVLQIQRVFITYRHNNGFPMIDIGSIATNGEDFSELSAKGARVVEECYRR